MDCLLEEIKTIKRFKKEHPRVKKYDDKKKKNTSESMKDRMARLRSMRGKK